APRPLDAAGRRRGRGGPPGRRVGARRRAPGAARGRALAAARPGAARSGRPAGTRRRLRLASWVGRRPFHVGNGRGGTADRRRAPRRGAAAGRGRRLGCAARGRRRAALRRAGGRCGDVLPARPAGGRGHAPALGGEPAQRVAAPGPRRAGGPARALAASARGRRRGRAADDAGVRDHGRRLRRPLRPRGLARRAARPGAGGRRGRAGRGGGGTGAGPCHPAPRRRPARAQPAPGLAPRVGRIQRRRPAPAGRLALHPHLARPARELPRGVRRNRGRRPPRRRPQRPRHGRGL
ncbi:MAG: hypothetical protein AVDCRST_MAG08-4114, partial [uncultured Acetobacteraceae bacterium]